MKNSTASLRRRLQESQRQRKVERVEALLRADRDLDFRAALVEKARRDPVFFFNQFCWTFDPRPEARPNHFPFITYEYEDDYIREIVRSIRTGEDLLTEKSRDMGASWMVLTVLVWMWLFEPAFAALIGSEKEDKCDNWDTDSLFGKLDYQVRRLPVWILPKRFEIDKHRTFMSLTNPENGNTIAGDSANKEFSRQGRYTVIVLDEFGFWAWGSSVWRATADATTCRLPISTPNGMNNKFADLRHGGSIRVYTLHWKLHPLKDKAWYEDEKSRRTPKEMAQELDIDYEASGSERVFTLNIDQELYQAVVVQPFTLGKGFNYRGGLDYGTRNYSAFHVFGMDYDENHLVVREWRRNMDELRDEGFKGSMVKAIAKAIFECDLVEEIDVIVVDPSLWVENQNTPKGMTSIILQITEEMDDLNRLHVLAGGKEKRLPGFCEGAQDDSAAIEVVRSLWEDPADPMLKIFKNCTGLIWELENLLWEDWSEMLAEKRSKREKIVDKNNHSWDVLKYYILSRHSGPVKRKQKYRDNYEAAEAQAEREAGEGVDLW